jgi:hypothetical protein
MSNCERHDRYEGYCKRCATEPLHHEIQDLRKLAYAVVEEYNTSQAAWCDRMDPVINALEEFLIQTITI